MMLTSLHEMEAGLVVATPVTDTRRVVASSQKKKNTKQVQVSSKSQESKTYNVRKDTIETKQNKQILLPVTISTCALIGNRLMNEKEIEAMNLFLGHYKTINTTVDDIQKFIDHYDSLWQNGSFHDEETTIRAQVSGAAASNRQGDHGLGADQRAKPVVGDAPVPKGVVSQRCGPRFRAPPPQIDRGTTVWGRTNAQNRW